MYLRDRSFNKLYLWFSFSIALVALFVYGIIKTATGEGEKVYDIVWNGYDSVFTLVMACSMFILCSRVKIDSKKWVVLLQLIGINTLGIYFLHVIVGRWFREIYFYLPINATSLSGHLLFSFLVLIFSLSITLLLKKIPVLKSLVTV